MPRKPTAKLRAQKAAYQRKYRAANPSKVRAAVASCFAKSKDKYNEQRRDRYKADGDLRNHIANNAAKWARANPGRRKAIVTKYDDANREDCRRRGKEWKKNNHDKCKTYKHARRARIKNCDGCHTTAEWRAILKRYGHRCSWCGGKEAHVGKLTRDHYIALSKHGSNNASNIVPACLPCNSKKNRRDPIEFANSLGLLL